MPPTVNECTYAKQAVIGQSQACASLADKSQQHIHMARSFETWLSVNLNLSSRHPLGTIQI